MSVVVALIFVLVIVLFSVYNAEPVKVSYLFGIARVSLALVIVLSALFGAVGAAIASLGPQRKLRRETADLRLKTAQEKDETPRKEV
jgi:uncharacterized integral membrane protein